MIGVIFEPIHNCMWSFLIATLFRFWRFWLLVVGLVITHASKHKYPAVVRLFSPHKPAISNMSFKVSYIMTRKRVVISWYG